jgi:hypothetical protein
MILIFKSLNHKVLAIRRITKRFVKLEILFNAFEGHFVTAKCFTEKRQRLNQSEDDKGIDISKDKKQSVTNGNGPLNAR